MITVTCEVRVVDHTGSHLLHSATDVATQQEPVGLTLFRVAALVRDAASEVEG